MPQPGSSPLCFPQHPKIFSQGLKYLGRAQNPPGISWSFPGKSNQAGKPSRSHSHNPGKLQHNEKTALKKSQENGIFFPGKQVFRGFSTGFPWVSGWGTHLGGDEDGLGARGGVGAVVGVLHQLHRPQQRLSDHCPQPGRGALRQQQRLPARLDNGVPAWKTAGKSAGMRETSAGKGGGDRPARPCPTEGFVPGSLGEF